jgi:hypothetical protein
MNSHYPSRKNLTVSHEFMEYKQVICIDTSVRDKKVYKNSGKFHIVLPNVYKNISSIRLSSFEFPNLFYTFSVAKENITFKIRLTSIGIWQTITITEGNYTSSQIANEIKTQLNLVFGGIFDTIADSITGKFTIFTTGVSPIFEMDFNNNNLFDSIYSEKGNESLGTYIGYEKIKYIGQSIYISEGIMDIVGDHAIFMKINDYGVVDNIIRKRNSVNKRELVILYPMPDPPPPPSYITIKEPFETVICDNNNLAKIIMYNNKNNAVFDNGANFITKTYHFLKPTDISKLNIEIVDYKGNTIDMKNMDYSFTLEVTSIYDDSNVDQKRLYDMKNTFDENYSSKHEYKKFNR